MSGILFRGYTAEAAVAGHLIVKPGTADGTCTLATAATDLLLGTADKLDKTVGEVVDVAMEPLAKVVLGGTVVRGQALTTNAAAKAVATTTAGNRIIGFAETSGVADDVITYLRAPGVL